MRIPALKNEVLVLGIVAFILIIPAFFINLGITPLIEDEATRALVSVEMDFSGQYVTPTVGGSYYYNKPPLFNWLVLLFYKLGGHTELMLRMPVVISLLLFGLTIFVTLRKHMGDRIAFATALMFITCGRILIYESLKGLIDIVFSWVLYVSFIILYQGIKNKKYFWAFLFSYILTAVAFLLKGLPAVLFQGFTVIVVLWYLQQWNGLRKIFAVPHMVGFLIFVTILLAYYLVYFHYNEGSYRELFNVFIDQNTRRTAFRFGFMAMVEHMFSYPFEMLFHFLPWTLLVVYFFSKKLRNVISIDFIRCSLWVLGINLLPYWTSPESFPRYILMLIPLLFLVLAALFEKEALDFSIITKVLYSIFGIIIALFLVLSISVPFLKITAVYSNALSKALFLIVSLVVLLYFYIKQPHNMLVYVSFFLLVVRIGFNLLVLPYRMDHSDDVLLREEAKQVGEFVRNKTVFVYGKPYRDWDEDKPKYLEFFYRFYISSVAHKIIRNSDKPDTTSYFIVNPSEITDKMYHEFMRIGLPQEKEPRYVLVRFIEP